MLLRSGIFSLLVLFVSPSVYGEIYRWVDDRGQVHFGDSAPSTVKAQTLDMPEADDAKTAPDESDADRLLRQQKVVRMLEEDRLEKERIKAEKAQKAEDLAKYCVRFKNRLKHMEGYTHFYDENDDGTRQYLDDKASDDYRARLKKQYQDECGP